MSTTDVISTVGPGPNPPWEIEYDKTRADLVEAQLELLDAIREAQSFLTQGKESFGRQYDGRKVILPLGLGSALALGVGMWVHEGRRFWREGLWIVGPVIAAMAVAGWFIARWTDPRRHAMRVAARASSSCFGRSRWLMGPGGVTRHDPHQAASANWRGFRFMRLLKSYVVFKHRDGSGFIPVGAFADRQTAARFVADAEAWMFAAASGDRFATQAYLASHDVRCPRCQYNLPRLDQRTLPGVPPTPLLVDAPGRLCENRTGGGKGGRVADGLLMRELAVLFVVRSTKTACFTQAAPLETRCDRHHLQPVGLAENSPG